MIITEDVPMLASLKKTPKPNNNSIPNTKPSKPPTPLNFSLITKRYVEVKKAFCQHRPSILFPMTSVNQYRGNSCDYLLCSIELSFKPSPFYGFF